MSDAKKESGVSVTSTSSVPKFTIFAGAWLGILGTYFNFFGYSYLKGMLQQIGFDYVSLNTLPFENIYIAIESFLPVMLSIIKSDFSSYFYKVPVIAVLFGGTLVLVFYFINHSNKKEGSFNLVQYLLDSTKSMLGAAKVFPVISLLMGGVYFALTLAFMGLLIIAYVIAALGMAAGESKGVQLVENAVCVEIKNTQKTVPGCREITLANGKVIEGIRLFKDDKVTYFITNDAAYELDMNNKVNMSIPIHRGKTLTP